LLIYPEISQLVAQSGNKSSPLTCFLVPASSQRDSLASSLDNFFSSTVPTKGTSGKKSPRKSSAQFNESDDDDDEIVVSSLSKYKSKQKETSRRDSQNSG